VDERSRRAVEAAERFADGLATTREVREAASAAGQGDEPAAQAALLRCVVGSSSHPPQSRAPTVLAWHCGAARRLAKSIYAAHRFEDLPVLADLLEDAGLTDAALLAHLRGPGPHCLGCWALDAVLDRP
jgi:hypothetical protein